jgi:hypothetical protein
MEEEGRAKVGYYSKVHSSYEALKFLPIVVV